VSQEGNTPTLGDVVSAAALVLGLITAWLYVTGWTYAYHYFDAFRIPMRMADLPKEHLFVYGGLVVWKNLIASLAVALAVGAAIAGCVRYREWLWRFGITTIVVILVLAVFALGRLAAIRAAETDFRTQRASDYDAYPRVRFALKEDAPPGKELLADLADSDCGRLVLTTTDWLFLIRPIRGVAAARLDTFVIPREGLKSLRVKVDNTSCP
jgi:MFS family permease